MELRRFIEKLASMHFYLKVRDGKLILEGDEKKLTREEEESIKSNHEIITYIKTHREQLIRYISDGLHAVSNDVISLSQLTPLQEGMLFHGLYEKTGGAYIEQFSCELEGLDVALLESSWAHVVKRHSILRSAFYYDAFKIPVQCVYQQVSLPITSEDYRDISTEEQERRISSYRHHDRLRGFDFQKAPLMRIALFRLSEARWRMVWTFHHILFDGWSVSVLMEEFLIAYERLSRGEAAGQEIIDNFDDFVRYLVQTDKEKEERYWREYLKGVEQGSLLPFIKSPAARNNGAGAYRLRALHLDKSRSEKIMQYAQRHRVTVNTIMQGVWAYLLYRYTGNANVIYGVTVSGRPSDMPDIERRVGLYINTVPLHYILKEDQLIVDWLNAIQEDQLESRTYQHTSLSAIQQWTGVRGDLFDSLLVFENYPVSKTIRSRQWRLGVDRIEMREQTNYALTIPVSLSDQISVHFNYNSDVLGDHDVRMIVNHFDGVLEQITTDEKRTVGELGLLSAVEKDQLLKEFNNTKRDYPLDKTIVDLFEEQAQRTPDRIAVVFEKERLTYRELDERSNQLGHYLRSKGVNEETLVPICMERSIAMMVGILGILKAGGAYVPVDPDYPDDRIAYMLSDTAASLVLCNSVSRLRLMPAEEDPERMLVDLDDWTEIGMASTDSVGVPRASSHLAYVIYTSGSTGRPKGVMIEHRGLVNRLLWAQEEYGLTESDAVLQKTTFCFDVSVWELLWPLLVGSRVVFALPGGHKDTHYLKSVIDRERISMVHFVPSMLEVFLQDVRKGECSELKKVLCSGEALKVSQVALFREILPDAELHNLYGPTEASIDVTFWAVPVGKIDAVPIGRPVANTQMYIVDAQGELCAPGCIGEICIGGIQVARGYLNREDLSRERFVRDRFASTEGARMYRTGDLGRWLRDGTIEYLGRMDDQVKIRGFRIELREIEHVLLQSGLVTQCVVLAKEGRNGNKLLVAYIVPSGPFDRVQIQSYLGRHLPEYMVPSLLVELERIPLTSNGKVDKKALPAPDEDGLPERTYVGPHNDMEAALANIWQEILAVERVGIHDNFFELGGHSLLAMRTVSAIRKRLETELVIKDLFVHPTIEQLARYLQGVEQPLLPVIERRERPTYIPLSYSQERLWFIDQLNGSIEYHIPAVLRLSGNVDAEALRHALRAVVNRHEVLRTVIDDREGKACQRILGKDRWDMTTETIDGGDTQTLRERIATYISAPFNLRADHMVRAHLIITHPGESVLVVVLHHIASDGWSMPILVKEVAEVYNAKVTGRPYDLPALAIQYADYALWQAEQHRQIEQKLDFWRRHLEGVSPLHLPTDYKRPAIKSNRGASVHFGIDKSLMRQLEQLGRREGATLFMTLLSAFKALLWRYSGHDDICVGSPVANRPQQEVEGMIGFFINTLALRDHLGGDLPFTRLLQQVKETTLDAYAHQDIPFEKVVEAVVKERDLSRSPLFQVMFALQNNVMSDIAPDSLTGIRLFIEPFTYTTSKHDLILTIGGGPEGWNGVLEYSTDLYSVTTAERVVHHYKRLLKSIAANPDHAISRLGILEEAEQRQLLEFSGVGGVPSSEGEFSWLKILQEKLQPGDRSIALRYRDRELSYGKLYNKVNQLSWYLREELGLKQGDRVVALLERTEWLVVTGVALLGSGLVYVPIDSTQPESRVHLILDDVQPSVVLTEEVLQGKVEGRDEKVVTLQELNSIVVPARKESIKVDAEDEAYIIYTSGSTGMPKGVVVTHGNLDHFFAHVCGRYGKHESMVFPFIASNAFDISLFQQLTPLLCGGTVVVIDQDQLNSLEEFVSILQKATIIDTVPGVYSLLVNYILEHDLLSSFNKVERVFVGGDSIPDDLLMKLSKVFSEAAITVTYGPTEATIFCTTVTYDRGSMPQDVKGSVIGRPMEGTRIYVSGKGDELLPLGMEGEICIGGGGVARGYFNRVALTKEKFIADPFTPGAYLYRTGDLGRWTAEGLLEFRGRTDDQVKIRGHRIELGEIESVLQQSGLVDQSVVVVRGDQQGSKRLIGYVVPKGEFHKDAVLSYLGSRLPEYMVPGLLMVLEKIPLTPNGKVDKNNLPPVEEDDVRNTYEGPRNEMEAALVSIWQDLLGVERIGIHDNFFELGGHSLLAMRVASSIRQRLKIGSDVKALFTHPTIAQLAEHAGAQRHEALLPPIEVGVRPAQIPLSYSQERLWFTDQLEGSVQYHTPAVLRLKGGADAEVLQASFRTIVNRHEVLRTVIVAHEGAPYQEMLAKDQWRMDREVLGDRDEAALRHRISELVHRRYDLSRDHMLRVHLLELGGNESVLVVVLHHIASDGWSIPILVKELIQLYNAGIHGKAALLPELSLQYADYSVWQRSYLSGALLSEKVRYWSDRLEGVSRLNLPTDRTRPAVQSTRGAALHFVLVKGLTDKVEELCRTEGVTMFMTLLAGFQVLLSRYSGQEDICVGSPVANRPYHEVEGMIGFFVNTVALRSDLSGNPTFVSLLRQVKETTLGAYAHQDVPFEKVVEAVVKERDLSRSPLFQVAFVVQNITAADLSHNSFEGIEWHQEEVIQTTSKFDLTLTLEEHISGWKATVEYCTDLFDSSTIVRMMEHYKRLLESIVADPGKRLGELRMVPAGEVQQLLQVFNATEAPYPSDKTIADLFTAQAKQTPDRVAVVDGDEALTYRELEDRSNQLAHYLIGKGVTPETLVPVCLERSAKLIVGILGILKAGGAYVPIDPDYPTERIRLMLSDTGARLILSRASTADVIRSITNNDKLIIDLDGDREAIGRESSAGVTVSLSPSMLAYVMYTSGSTGVPKGVEVEHGNVVSLVKGVDYVKFRSTDVLLATGSPSFDASTFEYWGMLLNGGKLVLCRNEVLLDPVLLEGMIHDETVTMMWFTAGWFHELVDTSPSVFSTLQTVLAGGDKLSEKHVWSLKDRYPDLVIINGYGPTENTTFSLSYRVGDDRKRGMMPIGHPLENRQAYILRCDELCPVGVVGEICVGGAGLSRGYLNREALTREKFIAHPFRAGARLYRTGDLGRWREDGTIEFLGRLDDQVKIRGYRVEPGEVEKVLQESGLVQQGIVVVQGEGGSKRLVSYVVAEDLDREALMDYLRSRLPEYMLPSALVELSSFPLTRNGKVDRKALPVPEEGERHSHTGARNALEAQLVELWKDLLEVEAVGVADNFFELGGHSLLGIRLISSIRKELGADVTIADIFDYPTVESLALKLSEKRAGEASGTEIVRQERPPQVPLSYSQERLWFIDQLEGSVQYHVPSVFRLRGEVSVEALQFALRTIVNRHEVLRTVICQEEGRPYQHVLEKDLWELHVEDVLQPESDIRDRIETLINAPFDLSKDHTLRACLLATDKEEYILVTVLHHIASDGWSLPILVEELVSLYNARVSGGSYSLSELPIQYADYSLWQRGYLQGEVLSAKLAYWRERLEGVMPLNLPTDHRRPPVQSTRGSALYFEIGEDLTQQLNRIGQEEGATLFMTLLSAFQVMLSRYSGQTDICVGSPVANRQRHEVEGLIGFFVNTLALRSDVSGNPPFRKLLQQVRSMTLGAYEHQDVPFEKVVEAVVKDRDLSRSPLFQVMFVLQNNKAADLSISSLSGMSLLQESVAPTTSKFDLNMTLVEQGGGLGGTLEYSTDLYDEATIERMVTHYKNLLASIAADDGRGIDTLSMLSTAEKDQQLTEFNNTKTEYPGHKTIIDLFEEQVEKTPDELAVSFAGQWLTYRQLDERSNQLAHYLISIGVQEGALVPVCLGRSLEMVIGILGILKAGSTYVPIDLEYPKERVQYVLSDTSASVLLCNALGSSKAGAASEGLRVVDIDSEKDRIAGQSSHKPVVPVSPEGLAYVIYTSGSTGRPKGVELAHRSLVNLLWWQQKQFARKSGRKVLQFASISFDVSFQEIFSTLCFGSHLYLIEDDVRKDIPALCQHIRTNEISHLFLPYTALKSIAEYSKAFNEYLPSLEEVITAGEQLKVTEDIHSFCAASGATLINHYGPSEAHVVSSYVVAMEDHIDNPLPPIGRPIDNTVLYILDKGGNLSPIGVPGELHIGGVQVARGYLNRPDLTAERFIKNAFAIQGGSRLYKTGDLARWLPDGNIEYLGRLDDQVKVRGYRVELGEIENVLQQSGLVEQCVVLAKTGKSGDIRLVAYIVPGALSDKKDIQAYLYTKLPEYMIPTVLVEIDVMPLTPNGKVDKRALPDPEVTGLVSSAYAGPRTEMETVLADIWQALLGIDRIGIHDNFFELGGHSLLATRVVSLVRKRLEISVSIRDVFANATIEKLASFLENTRATGSRSFTVKDRPLHIPLSFSQERLWFIDQLEGSIQYHIPSVFKLSGDLSIDSLQFALRTIVNRHEALRTVIRQHNGKAYQHVMERDLWGMTVERSSGYSDSENVRQRIQELIQSPFDLRQDHMLRANLLVLRKDEHILVMVIHHIASDGWSLPVLVNELTELYNAHVSGRGHRLPALDVQYADYSLWQREYLKEDTLVHKLAFWKERLAGVTPLNLPTDHKRPPIQSTRGSMIHFNIGRDVTSSLMKISQQEGATLFMTLLSAFQVMLSRYSNQDDICVGSPVANRSQHEVEGLIGFFVNTLALRSDLSNDPSFTALLRQVRETTLDVYEHQDVPFEKVVEAVVRERDLSRTPLFQVVFVLQNQEAAGIRQDSLSGVTLSHVPFEQNTAKFDLTMVLTEHDGSLTGGIEYCTDLYERETMERMVRHYKKLLESIVADPGQVISKLSMLTDAEEQYLSEKLNGLNIDYPRDKTIVDLFEEQVKRTPDGIAVVFEKDRLTYRELNEQANRLGHYLRAKGVAEETLVPVCMGRSAEMIIAILGILKAGGVYVPVDPEYPADRIGYMLKDTQAAIVVADSEAAMALDGEAIEIIRLDRGLSSLQEMPADDVTNRISPDHLAYVIYTSGSTGRPKGVMIEHRNVVRLFETESPLYDFNASDVWTMFHSFCFDFSVWEMYGALFYGGRLVVVPRHVARDTPAFAQLLAEQGVTILNQTPSAFYVLQDHLMQKRYALPVRYVIFGGEALAPGKLRPWKQLYPGCHLINMYGITETTVHVTYQELEEQHLTVSSSVIGKPIPTLTCYILDRHRRLAPVGVPGELYVSGAGLARGYLNRGELTAERFIANPFGEAGSRLYKTGDLGRWLADGSLEYLGRIDDQIKIRGYRIELGEIESVLEDSGFIKQGVVLLRTDGAGGKQLVAYVVAGDVFERESLMRYLKSKLPDYMVPSLVMVLESLPLTSNGKVNKKALPEPDVSAVISSGYVAPASDTEKAIVQIWQSVLGIDQISVADNFFDLGGDSIKVISIVSLLEKELGVSVRVFDVYQAGTVRELANVIAGTASRTASSALREEVRKELETLRSRILAEYPDFSAVEDVYPMSDIQVGMVYASILHPELGVYFDQFTYELVKELDFHAFEKALSLLVQKHSILRTAFSFDLHAEGVQIVYGSISVAIDRFDIQELSSAQARHHIESYLQEERNIPFDITKAPLWRAALFTLRNQTTFVFQCHHAILDGWSIASLNTELNNLYLDIIHQRPLNSAGSLKSSQKDFILESIVEKRDDKNKIFWQQEMADYKRLDVFSSEPTSEVYTTAYEPAFLDRLKDKARQDGVSLKALFLGSYLQVLSMLTPEDDLTVGLVGNTRPLVEDGDKLLGCFLNTIPFRFSRAADENWKQYFERIEHKLTVLKERDRTTLFDIVKITGERSSEENPFFDTLFNFTNFHVYEDVQRGFYKPRDQDLVKTPLSSFFTNTYLDFSVDITGKNMILMVSLRRKLQSGKTLEHVAEYFGNALHQFLDDDENRIERSALLSQGERSVLERFATDGQSEPGEFSWRDRLHSSLLNQGIRPALRYRDRELSYGDLNKKVNQLSWYFREVVGLNRGDRVVALLSRTEWLVVAGVALLDSGLVFVPVDSTQPENRVHLILNDVRPSVVLTEESQRGKVEVQGVKVVTLAELSSVVVPERRQRKESFNAEDEAYIIYTSGSTGMPKGVVVTHGNLDHFFAHVCGQYGKHRSMVFPFIASSAFDISLFQQLTPLLCGGTVVVIDQGQLNALEEFVSILRETTVIDTVPGVYNLVVNHILEHDLTSSFTKVERVFIGGDSIPDDLLTRLSKVFSEAAITVTYGPTEGTIFCTTVTYAPGSLPQNVKGSVIGRPMAGTRIYVSGKGGELLPLGMEGEICIGGGGVAAGYFNRADLTKEKFIADPFTPGAYLYRTGDLGRWTSEGLLEFRGRADDQVKIRGHRIELGEVENALRQHVLVEQAIVLAKQSGNSDKELVAYVAGSGALSTQLLREHLSTHLPVYMVPDHYLFLERLPLTSNGKVDKRAMLAMVTETMENGVPYSGPRNELEEKLVEIWSTVLGIEKEKIGIDHNFFDLGGNSLKIIKLSNLISKVSQKEVSVPSLFQYTNIRSLVQFINQEKPDEDNSEDVSRDELLAEINKFNIE